MPEICRFDPSGCGFPSPRVPLLPAPGWKALSDPGADRVPEGLLEGKGVHRFARGRYSLRAACQAAGLGPGGLLLAPSYHCRSMLDPALALGAGVALYALHADLRPDLDSIESLLREAGPAARVLLVPHYFGFEQPAATMEALAALCRRKGLLLIEDCAHAWMVAQGRASAGLPAGRMVVASPYKYFACPDGGLLWGEAAQLPPQGDAPGLLEELKVARRMLPSGARPPSASGSASEAAGGGAERREYDDRPSHYYDPTLERRDAEFQSRWLIRQARPEAIARQRRARYRHWLDGMAGLAHARALLPSLPDMFIPYMFPLLISRPDSDFFHLKHAGLPIWRWDDMAVSACPVGGAYRLELLHLPCHQGLSDADMDWMLAQAREVLA